MFDQFTFYLFIILIVFLRGYIIYNEMLFFKAELMWFVSILPELPLVTSSVRTDVTVRILSIFFSTRDLVSS